MSPSSKDRPLAIPPREGVGTDATAAAPPDSAGHQGSHSVPSDSLQEPTSSSPYGPPLHHDPASASGRAGSLGVFVLLAILILGLIAIMLYA